MSSDNNTNKQVPLRDKLFIGGKWVESSSGKWVDVIDPATEKVFHRVPAGNAEDVDKAVAAARAAFDVTSGPDAWSTLSGKQRAVYLRKIASIISSHQQDLGRIETRDCGKPLREALWDVDDVAGCFNFYADLAEKLDEKQDTSITIPDDLASKFKSTVQYDPVGVVAAIVPWNYPMLMSAWKVAPALAAGCTVILKPSEYTPLTALELASYIEEAQVPKGVFNVITGYGPDAGVPLTKHKNVDKIAFTGSVPTGRKIMISAAERDCFHVSLELGGKSPFIVFDDSDIEEAVEWIMFGCFWTNGQICSATSRLLVQRGIAGRLLDRLKQETEKIFVGDPFTESDPSLGPVVSKQQYDTVLRYISQGKKEGAKVLTGGERAPNHQVGYYILPTVFTDVKEDMTIWKEEIFGPVLSVMQFDTEEDAIRLANDSLYGLGAAVMSKDKERCTRLVKRLRSGIVWVNCSQPCMVQCPWGGNKSSGSGHRELGEWGLENYLNVKQVTQFISDQPWGWYIKKKTANL